MPYIKPHVLHPQHGTGYHASFLGIADGTLVANDLVVPSGYSGDRVKWRQTIADDAAKRLGIMAVRIVSHKLITGVDTSASTALGYPIYLADSAGGWTADASTTSVDVIIGTVLVDHDTTGAVLLAPAHSVGIE